MHGAVLCTLVLPASCACAAIKCPDDELWILQLSLHSNTAQDTWGLFGSLFLPMHDQSHREGGLMDHRYPGDFVSGCAFSDLFFWASGSQSCDAKFHRSVNLSGCCETSRMRRVTYIKASQFVPCGLGRCHQGVWR